MKTLVNKKLVYAACLLSALPCAASAAESGSLSDHAPAPCLDRLITKNEIALAECQNRGGKIISDRGFSVWQRPRQKNLYGFLRVKKIGDMPDGATAYFLIDNGGGSGLFSSIITARREGEKLRKILHIEGGDRCSNGMEKPRLQDGHIIVRRVMTTEQFAANLAALLGMKPADPYDFAHFGRDDWPYCAICCVADREVAYDASGKTRYKSAPRINLKRLREQANANDAARCLLTALGGREGAFLTLRGDKDALALARKIQKRCAKRDSPMKKSKTFPR